MRKVSLSFAFAGLALGAAASLLGQVTAHGAGASKAAVIINTKDFAVQVAPHKGLAKVPEHGFRRVFGVGPGSSTPLGGVFEQPRIGNLGALFPAIGATGSEPPDPDIAVGPNHIVEVVNSDIAFFTKAGNKTFQQSGQQFFASVSPEAFDFDPKVIYDQIAKRFVVVDLGLNDTGSSGTSSFLIAVSDDSDPTGVWSVFKVNNKQTVGSNNYWLDYPGFGYNKDMIVFSGNMFAMQGSTGFNGVQIMAFDKATLYGGTATPFSFTIADDFTVQLAKTYDSTTPVVYAVSQESNSSVRVTAVERQSASAFSVKQTIVGVPQWFNYDALIQGPGGIPVQNNDPRILTAASLNGRLVASHCAGVSASDRRPAARWYEFKTNNWPVSATLPTLNQAGQVNPPAGHGYNFPAVALDSRGGIALAFTKIGTTTPGQLIGCGRRPSDPPGAMSAPVVLDSSTGTQYQGFTTRWGDYFDVEQDPSSVGKFWAVGMGAGDNNRWQTYIKSFVVTLPDTALDRTLPGSATVNAGRLSSGDRVSLFSDDSNNFVVRSEPVRGLGQVAGTTMLFTLPYTNIDTLRVTYSVAGVPGASASVFALNQQTGVYEVIDSVGLTTDRQTRSTELLPAARAKYVSSLGAMTITIRATLPVRSGRMPGAFSFAIDKVNVLTSQLN
ncbi:MAG: hypothetical protein WCK51_01935 [Armatimonadota bacterium]